MHFEMSSANAFKLDQSEIMTSGNGSKAPRNLMYSINLFIQEWHQHDLSNHSTQRSDFKSLKNVGR